MCIYFQSLTLKEACKNALTILKQVMEEKLNSTNVEVSRVSIPCFQPSDLMTINYKTVPIKRVSKL